MSAAGLSHAETVPRLAVTLPPSSDGSSFEAYVAQSAPTVAIGLPPGQDPAGFSLTSTVWQLPQAMIAQVSASAQTQRRGPEEIRADLSPPVSILLLQEGRLEVRVDGRRVDLGPGDIVVHNYARPFESTVETFTMVAVFLARERSPPVFLAPGAHGSSWKAGSGPARLVSSALTTLVATLDGLSVPEADAAVEALSILAGGMLEAALAGQAEGRSERWGAGLLEAALGFIAERSSDPELTPSAVAQYLGASRSGLYRLFEPHGGVEAAIRKQRLDHAVRHLLVTVRPLGPLREVAIAFGFRNEHRFLRAFQARFGCSPDRFRDMVAGKDQGWLAAQAQRAGFASLQAWIEHLSGARSDDV